VAAGPVSRIRRVTLQTHRLLKRNPARTVNDVSFVSVGRFCVTPASQCLRIVPVPGRQFENASLECQTFRKPPSGVTPKGVKHRHVRALHYSSSVIKHHHSSLAVPRHRCRSRANSGADHGSSKPGRRSALWSNVRVRAQPARVPSAPISASANEPSPLLSATMAVKTSCSFSTMRTSV
jgi:hypothetical protein